MQNQFTKIAIVGSGPSALAAFWGLQGKQNLEITFIDSGITPENSSRFEADKHSKFLKLRLDDDFPYRRFKIAPQIITSGIPLPISFALGGLSNVWGATMLPFAGEDTVNWPSYMKDLEQYYLEISKRVPISQLSWKLSKFYKLYANREGLLNSHIISRLLERSLLWDDENECAPMPLAVKSASNSQAGCIYCNECLRGCPYDFIWRTNHGIEQVLGSDSIRSITGARVIRVDKTSGRLDLSYKTESGEIVCLEGFDHVFLGTGPIESFRIASVSGLTEHEADFMDSNTFLVPFLNFNGFRRNPTKGYALTQAYLRCKSLNGNLLHTQFYVYSNEILKKAKSEIRILRLVPERVISMVLSRLVFGIVYLDGSDSAGLHASVNQEGDLYLKQNHRSVSRLCPLQNVSRLFNFSVLWKLRLIPVLPLTRKLKPGAGAHFGAWASAGIHTDSLGRLKKDFNVHLVDSSVLPSIPPGPITFSVMANAFRIANAVTL
jgi:hypothetical protein